MKTLKFSAALLTAGLLVSASAFAQSTPAQSQPTDAQKQRTQWGGMSCNLVADAKADPECAAYLRNKSENLAPAPIQASDGSTGQK
jgi:hypothetical protein